MNDDQFEALMSAQKKQHQSMMKLAEAAFLFGMFAVCLVCIALTADDRDWVRTVVFWVATGLGSLLALILVLLQVKDSKNE